jgi:membrane protein DedA with SNARE-associated domain
VSDWTPRDYAVLVVTGTACLCLVILVLGIVLGVINGVISAELLGRVEGVGVGGGLLGLGVILYLIIKASLEREPKS